MVLLFLGLCSAVFGCSKGVVPKGVVRTAEWIPFRQDPAKGAV